MTIAIIDAIADYLVSQGVGGGVTGWTVSRETYTDADQDLAVLTVGGRAPRQQANGRVLNPSMAIWVRGTQGAPKTARLKAEEVLSTLDGATISGLTFLHVIQSDAIDIGPDDSGRPLLTINFRGQE